jgi:transposase
LEDELMKTIDWYELQEEDIIFQQNNASIHTPKKVSEWLENNNITVLRWSPHSPDLKPIENL